MKTATFQYRCRRCQAIVKQMDVGELTNGGECHLDPEDALTLALWSLPSNGGPDFPDMVAVLNCDCRKEHGGHSVGDLIGYVLEDK